MSDVFCFADANQTPTKNNSIPVAMYQYTTCAGFPKIGGPVISAVRRLGIQTEHPFFRPIISSYCRDRR